MKPTLAQLSRLIYLPDFKISSGFRTASERHREFNAIDIVPIYPKELNQFKTDQIFAKYLNKFWNGGFGINFSDCRHIHLDIKPGRDRWLEKSKPGKGTCSERLTTSQFPNLGEFNENDQKYLRKYFYNRDPIVYLNNQKTKLSDLLQSNQITTNKPFSLFAPEMALLVGIAALLYFHER